MRSFIGLNIVSFSSTLALELRLDMHFRHLRGFVPITASAKLELIQTQLLRTAVVL